jgi:cytochrome c551/c552
LQLGHAVAARRRSLHSIGEVTLKRRIWYALGGTIALLGLAQLIPVGGTNPPSAGEIDAPPEVSAILQRACYDCHSNKTVWPWYSHVAPVSWLVASDVSEGREHLNFTEWGKLDASQRAKKQRKAGHEVSEGDMPEWYYVPMHPHARLTDADRKVIERWGNGPTSGVRSGSGK